jgi:hypothetical protein
MIERRKDRGGENNVVAKGARGRETGRKREREWW